MDSNGFSDPYVKLTVAGHQRKSKIVKKTLNPRWNETFDFEGELSQLIEQPLDLQVWDSDGRFARSDPCGVATLDLSALRSGSHGPLEYEVLLDDGQQQKGRVYLTVTWFSMGGAALKCRCQPCA